ncbi:MAG: response regulator, partial [Tannerella sp.]|nr:response regulator [Tannerella sp.]
LSPINRNGVSAAYKICNYSKDLLLIGTQGDGLYLYDIKDKKLISKQLNSNKTLFSKYILSLYVDEDLLIVGHDDTGIAYYPFSGDKKADFELKHFFVDNQLLKVTSIFKGKDSRIWLGTKQNGLISVKYNPHTKTFTDYIHYDSFSRDEITGFADCAGGKLWISSHSGLYLFNTITNKVEENKNLKITDIVYSLMDDKKNNCLWLGTSIGLRKLDYSGDFKISNPFSTEILPEGAIYDLSLDADNNLWFSIINRIFCLMDDGRKLKEINTEIFGNQAFFSSSNILTNGKKQIVFGGSDNLLLIDTQDFLQQPEQTKIILTELNIDHQKVNVGEKIHGRVVLNEAAEYVSSILLSYLCKWISLSFTETGWDFYRNKYQYRIEGFSNSWQYLDITKPLTFSQLRPGEYTLSIRLYTVFSENEPEWRLHISILPPWWQTEWFYALLFALIALAFVMIFYTIRNYYKKRQQQRSLEIEKRKKEELLQEKESFFAGLSHDLLTPFSLIIAPANDMLREKGLQEENREKIEIIAKNATFLSDIFTTILDMKRAEIIDSEIKEKQIELVSFCKIIVNAFDYLAKSKQITLSFTSEVSDMTLLFDTVKLERILYNLLSNSIKFTPEGGNINVLLTGDEEKFGITVSDTGVGIDSKNLSKVFNKFYQEAKYRNNMQGLGLGLYIVRNFVDMLGGTLDIKSEPEKGTTISIRFSYHAVTGMNDPLETTGSQDELPSILLVEDNNQLREYLKKELSSHFYVTTAGNGIEALEFISHNLPEIVISDVMMPEMDGLTLCNSIKTTPLFSDIFVVLLSAKSTTEDELQGYKAGADFYIKKPFDSQVLIKQILNVYTTRQQRRKQIMNEFLLSSSQTETAPKNDFLGKAIKVVEEHLMDENFRIEEFAAEMNVSKTILHRKFKVVIGETPNIFIRNVRLHKAFNMLKETDLSVAEIAYLTGFSQSHYFIKCFKELFGETPKKLRVKS